MAIVINSLTPVSPVITSGDTVTFIVSASDTDGLALSYEWQYSTNGGATYTSSGLFNNTSATFTTSPISQNQSGIYFRVLITNTLGTVVASNEDPNIGDRIVTVTAAPLITVLSEYDATYTVAVASTLNLETTATVLNVNNSNPTVIGNLSVEWQYSTNNGVTWSNVSSGTFSKTVTTTTYQVSSNPLLYGRRSILSLTNIAYNINGYQFRAIYTYNAASNSPTALAAARVLVNPTISIFQQPGQNANDTKVPVQCYKTSIVDSGRIRVSIGAFTTSGQTLAYSWEFATVDYNGVLSEWSAIQSGIDLFWFRYRSGTGGATDVLELDRTIYFDKIAFRCIISGSAGEVAITSDPYYIYMKDVQVQPEPLTNKESLEDFYDPAVVPPDSRIFLTNYPMQTVLFETYLNVSRNNGLNGKIYMEFQRKAPGASTFTDLGSKAEYTPSSTDTYTPTPTNAVQRLDIYHTTPPVRIDLDDQSKYRIKIRSSAVYNLVNGTKELVEFYTPEVNLTVFRAIYVTSQPTDISVFNNQSGAFLVGAVTTSPAPITYQWQDAVSSAGPWQNITNGGIYSGATTSFLVISPITQSIQRKYFRAVVNTTKTLSGATSAAARIIAKTDSFSSITALNDIDVDEFEPVSWTVEAQSESLSTIAYQWQKSTNFNPASPNTATWTNIPGETSQTFSIISVVRTDAAYYRCLLTSFGGEVKATNAAKLTINFVEIRITKNLPSTLTFLEGQENERTLSVSAIATRGPAPTYQWQIKRVTDSVYSNFGLGYEGQQSTGPNFVPRAFDAVLDNGAKIRCRISAADIPNEVYSNECTISVNRRFYYFADVDTKSISVGRNFVLDLRASATGGTPAYQWQRSTNNGVSWSNISGETSPVLFISNVSSGLNGYLYRCQVTLVACTQYQYSRNNTLFLVSASEVGFTQTVRLSVTSLPVKPKYYSKEIEKTGAAIGTVICVPKPPDYVNDPSATTDDIDLWRTAITGDVTTTGAVSSVVSSGSIFNSNKPSWVTATGYRSPKWLLENDRFPGFIELRGQWVLKSEFPLLYEIIGDTYGSTSTLFKLPNPYGKKLMGTGNVNNNGGNISVVPLFNPDGTSGGDKNEAGSIGGLWNYSRSAQLPPGSPGDSSLPDGTAGISDPSTFSIGNFVTENFTECEGTANTRFTGSFSFRVGPILSSNMATAPPHSHAGISAGAVDGYNAHSNGCDDTGTWDPPFYAIEGSEDSVLNGPEGVPETERGQVHTHGVSYSQTFAGNGDSNHGTDIGDTTSSQSVTGTYNIHFQPGNTSPSANVNIETVVIKLTNASKPIFNSALRFYLRNNEELPVNSNYFRLKYLIKAY